MQHRPTGQGQRRTRTALVALTAASLSATALFTVQGATAANPPTGPGNIEIFAKRDMVAIEGYVAQAGQEADITVTRGGNVIGMTSGVVDATGFLEVNHPGGVCWGMVTPNIQGGDEINVKFTDGSSDGAVTGSAKIDSVEKVEMPATEAAGDVEGQVVIKGTYGEDVNPARMEVEIVNPDMRNMGIGERAIGWPSDDAPTTYAVEGTAAEGNFEVTYGFFSAAERDAAFAGDPAVATWQADATGVEMQLGLTISEFKEIDGPGFGGCPAGPTGQAANPPANVFASANGSGSITATWESATVPADAPAITGYELIAKDTVLNQEVSTYVGADATTATLRGLVDGQEYPVEVVAMNGQSSSTAASGGTVMVSNASPTEPGAPAPAGGVSVKDGSMAGSAEVTWTAAAASGSAVTAYRVDALNTDGSVAAKADAGAGATSATITGLTGGTEYSFVVTAISSAGETSAEPFPYTLGTPELTAPTAPTVVRVVPGNGSANVEWQPATAGNTPITGYLLTATPGAGDPITAEAAATATSATLEGLTNGTTYTLSLVATSAAGNSEPASFGSSASVTLTPNDQLTGTAQYRSDDREWRVSGSASVTTNNTITIKNATGATIGTATVGADGAWTYRGRNSTATYTPTVQVTSSAGGKTTINATSRR